MSHAHPLPGSWEGLLASSTATLQSPLSTCSAPATPQVTSQVQEQKPLNRQSHLLRLRHAGFRGPSIPVFDLSRTSPTASSCNADAGMHGDSTAVHIREGSPNRARSRRSSPLGILEEIHNTSNQRRSAVRRDFEICQSSSVSKLPASSGSSVPTEKRWTPYSRDHFEPEESCLLQEPSQVLENPSYSPTSRISHGQQQKSSTESEATRYIEHLEAQLENVQKQLYTFTSQSASKSQSSRLRALISETRGLRAEVIEWENKFNERIRSELEGRINLENGLRSQIKFLEKEKETKDGRIKDLEAQTRSLHDMGDELDTLQVENDLLKQRLHAISTAVVSPSYGSEEHDESLMAHLASPTAAKGQRQMLDLDGMLSSPLDGDFESMALSAQSLQHMRAADMECPMCGSFMPSSQDSSTCFSRSRPNSMTSTYSCSPSTGDSAQSFSQTSRNRSGSQRRRMRRFSSGSSGPKKLLLPNTTIPAGGPTSAPPDMPQKTWDETTPRPKAHSRSRLSMHDVMTPRGSSSDLGRESPSWNDAATLALLEANYTPPNPWQHSPVQREILEENGMDPLFGMSLERRKRRSRPQSLFAELSKARASAKKNDHIAVVDYLGMSLQHNKPSPDKSCHPVEEVMPRKNVEVSDSLSIAIVPRNTCSILSKIWFDPLTLSRKVMFNAWHRGSKDQSAKDFGWWFLGLLLGPIHRDDRQRRIAIDHGMPDHNALPALSNSNHLEPLPTQANRRRESQSSQNNETDLNSKSAEIVSLGACSSCDAESADSTWDWIRLTAALMFAVGISIREGPGVLLIPIEPETAPKKAATSAEDQFSRCDEETIPRCE